MAPTFPVIDDIDIGTVVLAENEDENLSIIFDTVSLNVLKSADLKRRVAMFPSIAIFIPVKNPLKMNFSKETEPANILLPEPSYSVPCICMLTFDAPLQGNSLIPVVQDPIPKNSAGFNVTKIMTSLGNFTSDNSLENLICRGGS